MHPRTTSAGSARSPWRMTSWYHLEKSFARAVMVSLAMAGVGGCSTLRTGWVTGRVGTASQLVEELATVAEQELAEVEAKRARAEVVLTASGRGRWTTHESGARFARACRDPRVARSPSPEAGESATRDLGGVLCRLP